MENKENKDLQGRREFFKQAARKALPIIGAVTLISNPVIAKAVEREVTDCERACAGSCGAVCTTCWMGCSNTCESCHNGCASSCNEKCDNGCRNGCLDNCALDCSGGCKDGCGWLANQPG